MGEDGRGVGDRVGGSAGGRRGAGEGGVEGEFVLFRGVDSCRLGAKFQSREPYSLVSVLVVLRWSRYRVQPSSSNRAQEQGPDRRPKLPSAPACSATARTLFLLLQRQTRSKGMSLDYSLPALQLSFLKESYTIHRLPPATPLPASLLSLLSSPSPSLISLTRTPHELSLILPTSFVLPLAPPTPDSTDPTFPILSGPWSVLRVQGPMDLSWTGILYRICGPLKEAGVPVFASSTYDTDYVLVESGHEGNAREALERAGWQFAA